MFWTDCRLLVPLTIIRLSPREVSHYVVTGPLRWPWVRLSLFSNAVQSHKRRSRP
jgi:hypothetical protein